LSLTAGRKRALLFYMTIIAAVWLTACGTYVPEGSTVVEVKNARQEYDRADLLPVGNDLRKGGGVRMKWYNTNTYITTATLSPGQYSFRARSYDGGGIERPIQVTADKHLYVVDARSNAKAGAGQSAGNDNGENGPAVSGIIARAGTGAAFPRTVSVLFIQQEIILRTAQVDAQGRFTVQAPANGQFTIQVIKPGSVPALSIHRNVSINGPVNLGTVHLQ